MNDGITYTHLINQQCNRPHRFRVRDPVNQRYVSATFTDKAAGERWAREQRDMLRMSREERVVGLVRQIAESICQHNRHIRSMPSEAEIERATPLAKSIVGKVSDFIGVQEAQTSAEVHTDVKGAIKLVRELRPKK